MMDVGGGKDFKVVGILNTMKLSGNAASDLYLQCGILQLHHLTALPAWPLLHSFKIQNRVRSVSSLGPWAKFPSLCGPT